MCIALEAKYVKITGSPAAGILLSQLCYWAKKAKSDWFYKTQSEWIQETGLTRYRIDGAQKRLLKLEFIQIEKRGIPAKNYYRVNLEKIQQQIDNLDPDTADNQTTSHRKNRSQVSEKIDHKDVENPITSDRKTRSLSAENQTTSGGKNRSQVAAKPDDLLHKITTKTTHKITTKITTEEPSVSQTLDHPVDQKTVDEIFNHWKAVMNHPNAKLEDKRKKLIRHALKMGYSESDLLKAITGCSLTPHNQGQNERGQRYDGLHIILRDAEQIDRFMRNADSPPRNKNKAEIRQSQNMQVANDFIAKLRTGEIAI